MKQRGGRFTSAHEGTIIRQGDDGMEGTWRVSGRRGKDGEGMMAGQSLDAKGRMVMG